MRSTGCTSGQAHVAGARLAVELAGADQHAGVGGQPAGPGPRRRRRAPPPRGRTPPPGITGSRPHPQSSRIVGQQRRVARRYRSRCSSTCSSSPYAGHRRRLHRAGDHEAGVLADLGEVGDQLPVAGVEPGPRPGQVRSLRQRVDGQHAVGAVFEDRARRAVPGELDVALVGQHGHAVGPPPGRDRAEVVEAAGRVARRVHPQAQRPGGIGRGRSPTGRGASPGRPARAPPGIRRGWPPWRRWGSSPRGTARCRARAAAAAASWGTPATSSLVPMQAAICSGATSTPSRRSSQPAAA